MAFSRLRRLRAGPFALAGVLAAFLSALLQPACAGSAPALTALPPAVDAALARAQVPREAMVAIVEELLPAAVPPRLAWRPREPVNPASLMKLLTTSAALELLGPAWQWRTPVWLNGKVDAGVLDGDLVIQGRGDPTLVLERVWLLLRQVQQAGVRRINGDIVLDRSAFAGVDGGPADFDGEALRPYNVRPDALLLNHKSIALTITPDAANGEAAIVAEPALPGLRVDTRAPLRGGPCGDWRAAMQPDVREPARLHFAGGFPLACGAKGWQIAAAEPARYNAQLLAALWGEMGGTLAGTVREGTAPPVPPTFQLSSKALAEVVHDINKFSNNVMAEQLFLTLGLAQRGAGTPEAAREVLRGWLAERFGSAGAAAVVDNGSGLSRRNRVSAQLLADLLRAAWQGPAMPELLASLPVPGVDGTLRRSPTTNVRAHLKTGSLRDVAGLAGVVLGRSGRRYAVVAVVNHPNADAARAAFEALLQWTADDGDAPAARPPITPRPAPD